MTDYPETKIVSTLGPVSTPEEIIRKLYKAGVTMFRINSSHDTMETHQATINKIRKIEKEENAIIPVLLDLQGPKIRIGRLEEPIKVQVGEVLKFQHSENYENGIIPVEAKKQKRIVVVHWNWPFNETDETLIDSEDGTLNLNNKSSSLECGFNIQIIGKQANV